MVGGTGLEPVTPVCKIDARVPQDLQNEMHRAAGLGHFDGKGMPQHWIRLGGITAGLAVIPENSISSRVNHIASLALTMRDVENHHIGPAGQKKSPRCFLVRLWPP